MRPHRLGNTFPIFSHWVFGFSYQAAHVYSLAWVTLFRDICISFLSWCWSLYVIWTALNTQAPQFELHTHSRLLVVNINRNWTTLARNFHVDWSVSFISPPKFWHNAQMIMGSCHDLIFVFISCIQESYIFSCHQEACHEKCLSLINFRPGDRSRCLEACIAISHTKGQPFDFRNCFCGSFGTCH